MGRNDPLGQSGSVYLLIGPKGSGKTFIGQMMQSDFGIPFVRVEEWAKKIKRDRRVTDASYVEEVFGRIEEGIRDHLRTHDSVVFESTGLSGAFDDMLKRLRSDFRVTTIGVDADDETCLARVRSRDRSAHVDVSDDEVRRINGLVREKAIQTDVSLENRTSDPAAIRTALRTLFPAL